MNHSSTKGFTLIELLLVIGILAVLATVTVLVLNPAELFRQARDSQRISDLSSVRDAIIFVTGAPSSTAPSYGTTALSTGGTNCNTGALAIYSGACTTNTSRANNSTGWVGVDISDSATGASPLALLPIDPSNGSTYYYTYKGTTNGFKLGAILESTKYSPMMVNTSDNGTASGMYEIGTILTAI